MFEMLGNWSFGDYFKEGAIDMAWEYLTEVLKLNPADLYVTVFEGSKEEGPERDNEAAGYWAKHVPADHIINGNKHDNFGRWAKQVLAVLAQRFMWIHVLRRRRLRCLRPRIGEQG